MELTISLDSLCRILQRCREYGAQVPAVDPDDSSNAADDGGMDALEEENATVVEEELRAAIDDLADDEQRELIALAMVGRGTYDATEWDEAIEAADEEAPDVIEWLLATPMIAAYLETGMAAFELNCDSIGRVG